MQLEKRKLFQHWCTGDPKVFLPARGCKVRRGAAGSRNFHLRGGEGTGLGLHFRAITLATLGDLIGGKGTGDRGQLKRALSGPGEDEGLGQG